MNAHQAIKNAIERGRMVSMAYLEDLNDGDMMHRPHPQSNHIKWQVGHLIASEHRIIESVCPGAMPPLPEGFAARYTKETAKSDDAGAFDSKEELLRVFEQQREATLAALDKLSAEELSQPAPEPIRSYVPTVGAAFSLQGEHWLMHAGQWAVVRRQLGRPPLF